jgi:amidase
MKLRPILVSMLGLVTATATLGAEARRFDPKVFYDTFSGEHPPALRIKSGEPVVTTTGDGKGMVGPFYVEGAEVGDLIVVTLTKLEPSGTAASSPSFMAPGTFDSGSLANKEAAPVAWTIDKAKGVVRLDLQAVIPNVKWGERYTPATYELPLKPMLGSLGVAPESKDAAAMAGPFGGDMDYAGLTTGTKILLPVYQPGALVFLGHGYARQGEGNVAGAGIAAPLDVEFSVDVVKKKEWPHSSVMRASTVAGEFPITSPRIETSDYIMAVGSASTLIDATQHATSELHHWMDDDYGFSERSLSIFLGQAIEYDIARIADKNYTVVAKVKRSYLPKETK